jgi:hypothetical protein
MKKSLLLAAAAVVAGIAPASAAVTTLGSTMARSCYVAALHREATMQNIEVCDRALQQQPLTVEDELATHVNRGILRMLFGDAGGADADFRRALALNANQPEAWLNLGVAERCRCVAPAPSAFRQARGTHVGCPSVGVQRCLPMLGGEATNRRIPDGFHAPRPDV